MEPLRGGKLVNVPKEVQDTFNEADIKRTPAEWGLRWIWDHAEVSVVLSGMNEIKQVSENVKIASEAEANSLNQKELQIIEKSKDIFKEKMKVNCTACEYCMPWPQGVSIPRNFSSYNEYHMFGKSDIYNWLKPQQRASNCIECGKCEKHCPQGIAIRQELKNVRALFE